MRRRLASYANDRASRREPPTERRRPVESKQTALKHGDPIGEPLGFIEVMGGHHNCAALCAPLVEQAPHAIGNLRIQAGSRFVEQENRRIVEQRARERDLLPHPFRQLRAARRCGVGEIEGVDDAIDRPLRSGERVQTGVDSQVFANGQPIPEPGRLGEKSDALA